MTLDQYLGVPRRRLAQLPTPLTPAPGLSAALGGPEIFVKHDELTGFALGGNKVRAMEFLLGDALSKGATHLVTGGAPHSNHIRVTAAGATFSNLGMIAVYFGAPVAQLEGNRRLVRLLGASERFTNDPDRASVDRVMETVVAELLAQGKQPYSIPRGGASTVGAMGYVAGAKEIVEQCERLGLAPSSIVLATGSCCTQAGLLAGLRALGVPWRVESFTVSRPKAEVCRRVLELAAAVREVARLDSAVGPQDVIVHDGFIGDGYGIPSREGGRAIALAAQKDCLFFDPTYTGKAMAGLIEHIRQGRYRAEEKILFLHTGGEPTIFAGSDEWARLASELR
jgi:D-cysteine desulfhydrase